MIESGECGRLNPSPFDAQGPEGWSPLRTARLMAAHAINQNVLSIPEETEKLRKIYHTHLSRVGRDKLRPEETDFRIVRGVRNALGMFANHRSLRALLPTLHNLITTPHQLLQADELERRRTLGQEYYTQLKEPLPEDEAILSSLLVDITAPVTTPVFHELAEDEQEVFASAHATLTEDLKAAGRKLLAVKYPSALRDAAFLEKPRGPAGKKYPGAAVLIYNYSPEPTTPFTGPFLGAADFVSPIISDAWRALDNAACPPEKRPRVLHKHLRMLSLPAALNDAKLEEGLLHDRGLPERRNLFQAAYSQHTDSWSITTSHPILNSKALPERAGECVGFDTISEDGISPVNAMVALGILIVDKSGPTSWFRGNNAPSMTDKA